VKNTEFIVGDATKVMPKLYDEGICPDVIVVDPPRSGCERTVLEAFVNMKPDRIIYVSCNPASLARDIAILDELGYRAVEVQPVDMFSETSHVESVTKLIKKN
jgi:23S rRNA (uracil1939-C5)-methyltransferase